MKIVKNIVVRIFPFNIPAASKYCSSCKVSVLTVNCSYATADSLQNSKAPGFGTQSFLSRSIPKCAFYALNLTLIMVWIPSLLERCYCAR